MDGNGRWAERRHRPRTLGHRAGARAVQVCLDFCLAEGIGALTLFAFSSENWNRPAEEVGALMKLFLRMLDNEVEELHRRGARIVFIGDRERIPAGHPGKRWRGRSADRRQPRDHASTSPPATAGAGTSSRPRARWPREARAGRLAPEAIDEALFAQPPVAGRTSPSPTCSSAPAATCASAISCSGSSPTPNCGSPRRCGPTWTRRRCARRSTTSPTASAASA